MKSLIRIELNKIFKWKINQAALCLLLVWTILIPVASVFQESVIVNFSEKRLEGTESIAAKKSEYSQEQGIITNESINELIGSLQSRNTKGTELTPLEASQLVYTSEFFSKQEIIEMVNKVLVTKKQMNPIVGSFNTSLPLDFYSEWQSKAIDEVKESDGAFSANIVEQKMTEQEPFTYDYANGWQMSISKFSDWMLGLIIVLGICLSNIFTIDRKRKMDGIIQTTKYGRKEYVISKVVAAMLFTLMAYLLFFVIYLVGFIIPYGVQGGMASVQMGLDSLYPFVESYLIVFLKCFLWGLVCVVYSSTLILLLSRLLKSASKTIVTVFLFTFLPYLFSSLFHSSIWLSILFPIHFVGEQIIFCTKYIRVFGSGIPATFLLLILVACMFLVMNRVICRNLPLKRRSV